MIDYRIQEAILFGTEPGERVLDVFYLCTTAALIRIGMEAQSYGAEPNSSYVSEALSPAMETMGKILCPIYDVVKPDDYVEHMITTRRSFTGIATSGELQSVFTQQIVALQEADRLKNLATAIESQIWMDLGVDTNGQARVEE